MKNNIKQYGEKELVKAWIRGFAIGFVLATSISSLMLLLINI